MRVFPLLHSDSLEGLPAFLNSNSPCSCLLLLHHTGIHQWFSLERLCRCVTTHPVILCLPVIPLMEVYNKSMCQPREQLVEILQEYPEEVEHIFIPSCVVLTRCAGYCNDEMLQCMPTSTYNITMEVSSFIITTVIFLGVGGVQ